MSDASGSYAPPTAAAAEPVEMAGEVAAVEVATGAVVAGAADIADQAAQEAVHTETTAGDAAPATAAGSTQWSAYGDGDRAAALGGRDVSTPPAPAR